MVAALPWWQSVRYGTLLPWAARSKISGAVYARLAGDVELWRDAQRRTVAVERIQRWLGVDARQARTIFRQALCSEAREEADVGWLMNHADALTRSFRLGSPEPAAAGASIWASLHLGNPTLAFAYLRCVRGLDVRLVARPLDDTNPMADAKRAWGVRKVRWLESVTGVPFLGTSAEATSIARSRLLKGTSIFVLMDVPGDLASRTVDLELFGENVRIASGVFVLAGLLGVPIRPLVAIPRNGRIEVRYGEAIAPINKVIPMEAVARALTTMLRDLPGEWWLWPYLPSAK